MSKYGKRAVGLLLTGVLCAGLLAGCGGAPEAAVTPTAPSESGSASGRRVETLRLEGGTDWGVPKDGWCKAAEKIQFVPVSDPCWPLRAGRSTLPPCPPT